MAVSMPIRVTCQCRKSFNAPESLAGRTVKCPNCGLALAIPDVVALDSPLRDLEELAVAGEAVGNGGGMGMFTEASGPLIPFTGRTRRKPVIVPILVAGSAGSLLVGLLVFLVSGGGDGGERRPLATSGPPDKADQSPAPGVRAESHAERADRVDVATPDVAGPSTQSFARSHAPTYEYVTDQLPAGLREWYGSGALVSTRRAGEAQLRELHYGWMVGLLPYLGHQDLFDKFDFAKPWYAEQNLQLTGRAIPELLNPADPRRTYRGHRYSGMALTHFVGVSGIEDSRNVVAATLPRSDVRAGIFGYEEIATAEQIEGGATHTLMVIGSGELACPWVQSGGSTIRGARAPYFGELTGFGSVGGRGRGAGGVMADGSVRWIDAGIDPQVFHALCTIADETGETGSGFFFRGGQTAPIHRNTPAAAKKESRGHTRLETTTP